MCAKRIVSRTYNELSKLISQEREKNPISKREKDIHKYYKKNPPNGGLIKNLSYL